MATKEKDTKAINTPCETEEVENANGKAIYTALKNFVYFDQLFREDLTGDNSGNNTTHISNRVKADNEKYGTKFPSGRQQLVNIKKMFISLGAIFRERGNDESGEGTCYEYKEKNSVIWFNRYIAVLQKDLKKNVLKVKKAKNSKNQEPISEPHDVWFKMYLKQMMNLNSVAHADYVGFYENMNLVGLEYFGLLLEYIIDKKPVEISYVPFNGEAKCVKVYPYFLKNYNQRWFLLGRTYNENPNEKHPLRYYEKLSYFALDRIQPLVSDDGKVQVPALKPWLGVEWVENDLDIQDYYNNMIGTTDTGNVQETVLRFEPNRYKYVMTKKMLPCQEEIQPGEEYYDAERPTIRMKAMQNRELVQQILSFGADVEVIKPDTLREEVKNIITKLYSCYGY